MGAGSRGSGVAAGAALCLRRTARTLEESAAAGDPGRSWGAAWAGLVITAESPHDRAGGLRGRIPCGGRGGGSGRRTRPGHPPPRGGAALPLSTVWPDLLSAAQPGAAPEGARRGRAHGRLRVPRVRQGLQRQAQPGGAPAHAHRRAALPLPRVRPLLQPQAEPAHTPAHPQRREAAPVRAVWPLFPRASLLAQPPAHSRAHASAAPAPPRRLRGAPPLLLPALWQELCTRGLAQDPPAQPRPRARGPGGPFRPSTMMDAPSVTIGRLWNPICVWGPWRWHWAAVPAQAGRRGEGEGWRGVSEGLGPPPSSPPPGPSSWLGAHTVAFGFIVGFAPQAPAA